MKKLGYYGLGKMGSNMVERLLEKGYRVVVGNRSKEPVVALAQKGATPSYSAEEFMQHISSPHLVWLMVSHEAVDEVLGKIVPLLEPGATIIDGGNSFYQDSVRRAQELEEKNINLLDVGVSGGPKGAREGACLMVGGKRELYERYEPIFKDLAAPGAYAYLGASGAGHFVKMVHNGIEYGMMQSIAEGFALMHASDFKLDLAEVARVYGRQSVIASRLVDWLKQGFEAYGQELDQVSGSIGQLGEGKWTAQAADELHIEAPVIKASVAFRNQSQDSPSYTGRIVSVLRNMFGGHDISNNR